jgi:hypothetical protein|tara:strand:- start:2963 stop:3079 length:117 start_codon:yes stop_codon:yes gene_type:complete
MLGEPAVIVLRFLGILMLVGLAALATSKDMCWIIVGVV